MPEKQRPDTDLPQPSDEAVSILPDEQSELAERCASGRETMRPRQTADCAGSDLGDQYDNEEDGGS